MTKKRSFSILKGVSAKQILIDLLVVVCGVYMAFYLNDSAEQFKINKRSERTLRSLKIELEQMRVFFPGQADYMNQKVAQWDSLYQAGRWIDYYNWRYLQPQYNYTVLEYAINERETEVLDFQLYKSLLDLYRNIRQLEEAERYMTETGKEYTIGVTEPSTDPAVQLLRNQNLFHFLKFIGFAKDRASSLSQVAQLATISLDQINQKFSRRELVDITVEMIQIFVSRSSSGFTPEIVEGILKRDYAYFTETERQTIMERLTFDTDK